MSTILIGIAGGTGSGKTTLTRHLKEHFGPEVTVIGHDNYYKRQVGKTYEERTRVNYDHPDAFDTDLLIEHLKELKAGHSIQCPVYSFVDHNRTDQTVEIVPTKVIIVEGKKNFACSDRACQFVMWKNDRFFEQRGKVFTTKIAAALLKDGKAKVKRLRSLRTGKTYDGTIVLADTGGKYVNYRIEK